MDHSAKFLLQGDHVRQDCAVQDELDLLGGGGGNSVLPDYGQEEWLVPDMLSPEKKDPGWLEKDLHIQLKCGRGFQGLG